MLVVKVVEPLIQEDTLVRLVEVAAPAVAILKPQVLETELFQVQQTTMMGTILLYQIRDSLVEQVDLVDRFEGEQLGENKVSQAFRLRYRGKNETLTDDKIQPVHDKVRAALSKQFQAELRS